MCMCVPTRAHVCQSFSVRINGEENNPKHSTFSHFQRLLFIHISKEFHIWGIYHTEFHLKL